ncbi:Single-stranded DNA-binding protein RIM1, mitochondrial [Golovinomyces cichoracearum]|uniref:Single-stranded DNA-binding protein RIM1, mitochondrial n=1 Tax=Golovinomyces cichoracearum TaxID=62708 RepID=A0A420IXY8_9PEZI|nr:Single-stranded DNA-binding protein RIM1, mitochondrial [Golovinomyces cichoracearum]
MSLRTITRSLASPISLYSRSFSSSSTSQISTFAKITIVGRLADTPESQTTSTGREILKYAVGTTIGRGENQKTSWFRVTSFLPEGPQRDFLAGLEKGTLVYVEGDTTMNQYQDSDGNSRNGLNIVQQKIEVLSSSKKPTAPES